MRARFPSILLLSLAIVFAGGMPTWGEAARLRVESDPTGLNAWAGEQYVGRTPAEAEVPAGPATVRLAYPSDSLFVEPVADTLVQMVEGESLTVRFVVGKMVSVRSRPFDLTLLRDDMSIGRTPLDFRLDPRRPGRIELETFGGRVQVPMDTLLVRGSWEWIAQVPQTQGVSGGTRPFWRQVGRYVMPGLAVGLSVTSIFVKDSADHAYDDYQRSVDPAEIQSAYDEAARKDQFARALWIAAEACIISSIVAWILPEHRPIQPVEERP